jgi:probable rRNA maturation factor
MTSAPRAARKKLRIDVLIDSDRWKSADNIRTLVRRAVAEAASAQSTSERELAIVLTDDSAIRQLNRLWRGVDAPTNVLSFPAATKQDADEPAHLGDIVLAYETIAREAGDESKPLAHHVAHLVVHGYLHLLGFDHERNADAEEMEQTERKILRRLAIPDPYRHNAAKRPAPKHRKSA